MARRTRWLALILVGTLATAPLAAQPADSGKPGPPRDALERREPGDKKNGPPRRPHFPRSEFGRGPGFGQPGTPEFDRMLRLAFSPDDQVISALEKISNLTDEGPESRDRMLRRVEGFRRMLREQALRDAEEMNLRVSPERESEFVQSYWRGRARVERTLREEMEPRRRQLMDGLAAELRGQFSAP